MPSPSDPQHRVAFDARVPVEDTLAGLNGNGTLPAALCGRFVAIGPNLAGDAVVLAVALHAGRPASYRSRWITDAARGAVNVLAFGGKLLALGPGALPYELDDELATVGRVDLAGGARGIGAHPQVDPSTGDLHAVSDAQEAAHHVVSSNLQTRTTRPIAGAPGPVVDLCLTVSRVVLLGDGVVGVADRSGAARPRWAVAEPCGAVNAHDDGRAVEVLATASSLLRWRIGPGRSAQVDLLDDTPQRFGKVNDLVVGARPRYLWSTSGPGGTAIYRHDLRLGARTSHDLGPQRHPGGFTYVPDPARAPSEDGGWLIGFVHDDRRSETDLIVLDAAAVEHGALGTVRIPQPIPVGFSGLWIPAVRDQERNRS